jgi:hypothetical protein
MLREFECESGPPPVLAGLRSAGADGSKILDVRRLRSRQVSKISVCSEHRKVPEAKRRDPDCGSPFLGLLSFGEAKESESPAAATERLQVLSTNRVRDSTQGFDKLNSNGFAVKGFDTSARSFDTSGRTGGRKTSTGSARAGGKLCPNRKGRRFGGQSTNSPSLRPALRVLRSEIVI